MCSALLSTKLYVPPLQPDVVPRPHLIERLNEGLARRLTLISAPPGFGKTTLLSEWLAQCRLAVAYVSLDEGDNDVARFLTYVVTALRRADPRVGKAALSMLRSPQPSPAEVVLTALINDVAEAAREFVLVLDDYHVVKSRAVHKAVSFLVEHLPPWMHLVIATRADPPLPLARLRARRQMAELRTADLSFSHGETAELLRRMLDVEVPAEDVAALAARTEGWAVGLQLAALSMKGRRDQHRFVDAFSGSQEYVADYLTDEVLGQLPDSLRAFLLQTSILNRLTGPLCDAVTGQGGSNETLAELVRANLFTVSLDGERRWYRYHRLFADLLRRRLEERQPEVVPELHRRASRWYEGHGFLSEAVEHALLAGDPERAAHLIEDAAQVALSSGEAATVRRWIESLPEELVRVRPGLCAYHAWCLAQGGQPLEALEARLKLARPGQAAAVRSFVTLYQGQIADARALANQAAESSPQCEVFFGTLARWTLEVCELVNVDIATATRRLEELTRKGQMASNPVFMTLALSSLASLRMRQGQLREADTIYSRAIALASDRQGNLLPVAGAAVNGQGLLRYEWNDLDESERLATQGIELTARWGDMWTLDGYLVLSRIRRAQGELDGAQAALERARRIAQQFDITGRCESIVDVLQIEQWIAQGDLERTARWVEEQGLLDEVADPRSHLEGVPYLDYHLGHHRYLTVARLWMAQGHFEEVLGLLDSLFEVMTERGWRRSRREIELQCLRALALQAIARDDEALTALEAALGLAEPGGYVRTFVDLGRPMARLLHTAAARGIRPSYVGALLAAFPVTAACQKVSAPPSTAPTSEILEPLSQRELEVLALMAVGLTDREIAERLVLSPQTVKVHARNIYDKLDVGNRTQAATRARALGLLRD